MLPLCFLGKPALLDRVFLVYSLRFYPFNATSWCENTILVYTVYCIQYLLLQVFRPSVLGICGFILACLVYSSLIYCSDIGEPLAKVLFGALQLLQAGMQVYALVAHWGYISTCVRCLIVLLSNFILHLLY